MAGISSQCSIKSLLVNPLGCIDHKVSVAVSQLSTFRGNGFKWYCSEGV